MRQSAAASEPVAAADRPAELLVMAATFACYLLTAPRTVVLEDDGNFLQAAWFNAVAHPPGYPLYVALAHVATLVPAGSVALRVHALTGLFAALACVALFRFARRLSLATATALAAALALGLSEAFWSQAIIADVYSLNVLLFLSAALLCLAVAERRAPVTARRAMLLGLCYGLGLSNHWPLLVLSTPMLLLLAWPARAELWRAKFALLSGLAAGLLPYGWLIWRTHMVPEFCFAGPIESWRDFLAFVGRHEYADLDQNATAGWRDKVQFAGFALRETARQFGWLGFALGLAGLVRQWRWWPRRVCWGMVLGFLGGTLLLILVRGLDYDEFHRHTFRVYPLISYAVFALWAGLGLQWVASLASRSAGLRARIVLGVLLVGTVGLVHWPANFRAADTWAATYARVVLDSLPDNAIFFGNADTVNGPLGYLHHVEGMRRDVQLLSGHSLSWDGKLYRPYAMSAAAYRQLLERLLSDTSRPVFYSNDFPHGHGADFFGLYFQVNKAVAKSVQRAVLIPAIAEYFRALDHSAPPEDPWESMHYRLLRQDQCQLLAAIGNPAGQGRSGDLPAACRGLHGRLLLAEQALAGDSPAGAKYAFELLLDTEALRTQAVRKSDSARLDGLRTLAEGRIAGSH